MGFVDKKEGKLERFGSPLPVYCYEKPLRCLRIINFVYVKLERRFQLATLRIINKLQFAS